MSKTKIKAAPPATQVPPLEAVTTRPKNFAVPFFEKSKFTVVPGSNAHELFCGVEIVNDICRSLLTTLTLPDPDELMRNDVVNVAFAVDLLLGLQLGVVSAVHEHVGYPAAGVQP